MVVLVGLGIIGCAGAGSLVGVELGGIGVAVMVVYLLKGLID